MWGVPSPCARSRLGTVTHRDWCWLGQDKAVGMEGQSPTEGGKVGQDRVGPQEGPEPGHGLALDQFDNSRAILTNPLIWPHCKAKEGRAVAETVKNQPALVQGLPQHCHLLGHPGKQEFVSHTHMEPALKFPAHICPSSREATPAHPKHSLCANTRLEEESVEPPEPVYCPYCHSTDRGHSPLPASLPRRPTELLGQRKLRPSCPQFSCWISEWPRTGRSCINPFSTSPTQPPGPWGGAGLSLLLPGRLSGRKVEQRDHSTPSSSDANPREQGFPRAAAVELLSQDRSHSRPSWECPEPLPSMQMIQGHINQPSIRAGEA